MSNSYRASNLSCRTNLELGYCRVYTVRLIEWFVESPNSPITRGTGGPYLFRSLLIKTPLQ